MEGWLYDGQSAVRRPARLVQYGGEWQLVLDDGERMALPFSVLQRVGSYKSLVIFGRDDVPGWRLHLKTPPDPALAALLPEAAVYGRWVDRLGLARAIGIGLAASAGILYIGYKLPDFLAPHVPYGLEKKVGDLLLGDIDGRTCDDPEGQRVLDKLTARLSQTPGKYRVRVVDIAISNAVALPGGTILFFKPILAEANGGDAIAGILAHEIAHVENRDVTRAMIRHYSFSLLLASVGGSTGGNIDALLSAGYSREDEGRADADAIATLKMSNVSPFPTARFFAGLADTEGELLGSAATPLGYLASHPNSESRRKRFADSVIKGHVYTPVLTREEWTSLQNICASPT